MLYHEPSMILQDSCGRSLHPFRYMLVNQWNVTNSVKFNRGTELY